MRKVVAIWLVLTAAILIGNPVRAYAEDVVVLSEMSER